MLWEVISQSGYSYEEFITWALLRRTGNRILCAVLDPPPPPMDPPPPPIDTLSTVSTYDNEWDYDDIDVTSNWNESALDEALTDPPASMSLEESLSNFFAPPALMSSEELL